MTDGSAGDDLEKSKEPRRMQKTPMFTATHAERYRRQDLIREIDNTEQSALLCYIAGEATEITRDDTLGFLDLLHNIRPNEPVDLMLHTSGGDVDACEKLIFQLQSRLGDARLRVIIPEMAKSAGTILTLLADEILMSATSELGMIDPQYAMKDSQGNMFWHSVVVYLREFDHYSGALTGSHKDTLAERMLLDFDAKVVAKFRGIETRIRNLAEGLLKRKNVATYTKIAAELLNSSRWRTHGQPISAEDAKDLGLPVRIVPMTESSWHRYMMLYCLQRKVIGRCGKLFESLCVSQLVNADDAEK